MNFLQDKCQQSLKIEDNIIISMKESNMHSLGEEEYESLSRQVTRGISFLTS